MPQDSNHVGNGDGSGDGAPSRERRRRSQPSVGPGVGAHAAVAEPLLPSNIMYVLMTFARSQQRVWSKADALLNMSSNVVTLETGRKGTCVCVCMDRNVEKAGIRGQGNV